MSVVSLLLVLLQTVQGQEVPPPSDPLFKAHLLDGQILSGRLAGIGIDQSAILVSQEGVRQEISATKLLKLARESTPVNPVGDGSFVVFPDGDSLLRVSIGSATENALDVSSNLLGKLKVPLESLLGVAFSPPTDRDALDTLLDRIRNEARSSEVVWMTNGDRRAGGFLGLGDRAVKFQVEMRPIDIDRAGVVALAFDPNLVNYPRPKSPFFEVSLSDGSRVGLTECQVDRGQLTGMTRFGQRIHLPLADLDGLYARSDAVEFLSEREVAGAQYVTYVGPPRPYRLDRAVDGGRLTVSGEIYERGVGTQSRTLLAYKLKPGDRKFQALVALDDRAGPLGSVAFRVLVDGKERFTTPSMSARDRARSIDIDLTGSKTLILITEFGARGDVRDLADWVDARIVH